MHISNKTLEGRKSIKNRWNSSRGANLVEMAMVLPLLLLLTFAIVDFSSLFYVYLALENGVSLATRYGVTGQQMNDPMNPTQLLSREDSVKSAMRQATPTLAIDDSAFAFEHLPTGSSTWTAGIGGPSEISRVTVSYTWGLITPVVRPFFSGGQINLRVSSTMKNEGFPTS
jgi:Flp pilus assembly protein TadG